MFDTPTRLAREYDVRRTFAFSCMEWAVHRGDVDAARTLLKRYLDAHPAARSRLDDARAAGLPPRGTAIRNELDWWGPTLETLGILSPGEPLPGTPRPKFPTVGERSRLRAILSEFGCVTEIGAD